MIKENKKYLYCPTCQNYPDVIIESYHEGIEEGRKWDGEYYELQSSNMDEIGYDSLCGKCRTRLIEQFDKGLDFSENQEYNGFRNDKIR